MTLDAQVPDPRVGVVAQLRLFGSVREAVGGRR
jgi:hypothetical protein